MTLEDKINEFIKYRKEIKKPIKLMPRFLKLLDKLSKGDEDTAIKILDQSMDREWIGIFELKQNYGKTNNNSSQTNLDSLNSAAERVLRGFANGFNQGDSNQQSPGNWTYQDAS